MPGLAQNHKADRVIQEAFAANRAVLLAGTGLSASLSNNQPAATWLKLIEHAIEMLATVGDESDAETAEIARLYLENTENLTASMLLDAADCTSDSLDREAILRRKWLEETVGTLTVENEALAAALSAFDGLIVTTNYDTLIEMATGREAVSFPDFDPKSVDAERGRYVVHLHGVWTQPSGVVYSRDDYRRILADPQAQAVQAAIATNTSLVMVGFGSGTNDPNLGRLLEWISSVFPNPEGTHYRVCRETELANARREHLRQNVEVVSYGSAYEDLPIYLGSLLSTGRQEAVSVAVAEAKQGILADIRSHALHLTDERTVEAASFEHLLVEPVLSIVPSVSLGTDLERTGSKRKLRQTTLQADEEIARSGVMLIAGDRQAGVTSALRWMLVTAAERENVLPIYIDAALANNKQWNVSNVLNRALRGIGHKGTKGDYSNVILAIDNLNPECPAFSKVTFELTKLRCQKIIVGCRLSEEGKVATAIQGQVHVAYLGQLGAWDVEKLAQAAAPDRWVEVSAAVVHLIHSERLPRTPATVAQLIAIAAKGGEMPSLYSSTRLLESYLEVLLGFRSDADDTEAVHRKEVLVDLAKRMRMQGSGALTTEDAAATVSETLTSVDSETGSAVMIGDLISRRLLIEDRGGVRFAQASYLLFFLGGACRDDGELRSAILERPLYYSAVIEHYAALSGRDPELIEIFADEVCRRTGSGQQNPIYASKAVARPAIVPEVPDVAPPLRREDRFDVLDASAPGEIVPFPAYSDEDLSEDARFVVAIGTLSEVLRSSKVVKDLELRRRALRLVLLGWSEISIAVMDDAGVQELLSAAIEDHGMKVSLDDATLILGGLTTVGGLTGRVAGRSVVRACGELLLDRAALDAADYESRVLALNAAIVLLMSGAESGNSAALETVGWFSRSPIVADVFAHLLKSVYFRSAPNTVNEVELADALVEIMVDPKAYGHPRDAAAARAQVRQALEKEKRLHLGRIGGALYPSTRP